MTGPIETVGPLVAALIYSLSTFLLRRATLAGVAYRTQLVWTGFAFGVTGIPAVLLAGLPEPGTWIPALLAGSSIGAGQFLTVLAVNRGDASVQTPLMGTKVIWVILISSVAFGIAAPARTWIAALLAAAAVLAIGFSRAARAHASLPAVLAALGSALTFAAFDSIVASGRYGGLLSGFFGMSVMSAGVSVTLVAALAFPRPDRPEPGAMRTLAVASVLLGIQFALQIGVVAAFGRAAEANIIYSTRGLWSVLLAWIIAHRADVNRPPSGVFVQRLIGSALLVVAVVLVI